jgi:hypothetical protein
MRDETRRVGQTITMSNDKQVSSGNYTAKSKTILCLPKKNVSVGVDYVTGGKSVEGW